MSREILTVRDVDERIWRKFGAKIAEQGLKTGEALGEALETWMEAQEEKRKSMKPDPRNIQKIRGFITTKHKVRWSEEIDQILYGDLE